VGWKTYDGVHFSAYVDDHPPPRFHGSYAGIKVIVELVDGKVRLARRKGRIKPKNAKRADVRYVVKTAAKYAEELLMLWKVARG